MASVFLRRLLRVTYAKLAMYRLCLYLTPPLAPGFSDGDSEVEKVQLTRCVISARWTVRTSIFLRNSGMKDSKASLFDAQKAVRSLIGLQILPR